MYRLRTILPALAAAAASLAKLPQLVNECGLYLFLSESGLYSSPRARARSVSIVSSKWVSRTSSGTRMPTALRSCRGLLSCDFHSRAAPRRTHNRRARWLIDFAGVQSAPFIVARAYLRKRTPHMRALLLCAFLGLLCSRRLPRRTKDITRWQ